MVYGPMVSHEDQGQSDNISSMLSLVNGKCQLVHGVKNQGQARSEKIDEKICTEIYQSLTKNWPLGEDKKNIRWPELAPHAPHVRLTKISEQGEKSHLYLPLSLNSVCNGKGKCQDKTSHHPFEIAARQWVSFLSR